MPSDPTRLFRILLQSPVQGMALLDIVPGDRGAAVSGTSIDAADPVLQVFDIHTLVDETNGPDPYLFLPHMQHDILGMLFPKPSHPTPAGDNWPISIPALAVMRTAMEKQNDTVVIREISVSNKDEIAKLEIRSGDASASGPAAEESRAGGSTFEGTAEFDETNGRFLSTSITL